MFYFVFTLLCLVAAIFVLSPLWLRGNLDEPGRQALNVELFRERIADLDEVGEGAEILGLEARRDLLTDAVETTQRVGARTGRNERWLILAALCVPLMAVVIYMDFGLGRGAISDVWLMNKLLSFDRSDETAHREMLDELADRAVLRPKDGELNYFLARSYLSLGNYDKSLEIFRRLLDSYPSDAGLQSAFAEALFVSNNRKMTVEVMRAVDKALEMNPHDISMLEVKGVAAIAAGRNDDAVGWFRKALATGASGQRADILRRAIANLGQETETVTNSRSLNVLVSMAEVVSVPKSSTVFVYARAVSGPPAPLAVQRLSVTTLPRTVILKESMAMMEGMSLADFDEVIVIARISRSGDVTPKPGDYEARSEVIDMNEIPDQVTLLIVDPVSL